MGEKRTYEGTESGVAQETADQKPAAAPATRKNTTEIKQAEAELEKIFSMSVDLICIADINTATFIKVNPAFTKTLGYSAEELLGRPFLDFLHPDDLNDTLDVIENKLKKGQNIVDFVSRYRCKDGSYRRLNWTSHPVPERGITYSIGRDETERKKLEEHRLELETQLQQAHKMEAIGTLAGGIAHDFNNILSIILGNVDLAMYDIPEWHPARHNMEDIRTAGRRARDVVRQLLSFARKSELTKRPLDIARVVKDSLKLLRSSLPSSIEIRENVCDDIDTIYADPTQINQVLINLCTNANNAMPDGGILEVGLENVEFDDGIRAINPNLHPGRHVKMTVSETGSGIDREEVDRIFDPYYTKSRTGEGTGMGLAVVHGIVRGHDGVIIPRSEPHKGTTFEIYFPATVMEAVSEDDSEVFDESLLGDEIILLVDDEQSIARIERKMLSRLGYHVDAVTSPGEALELFRETPDKYDLIISDMTMPRMTGDKLVKEFLDVRSDIPVILRTGYSVRIDEERAKQIGAAGYVEKPVNKHELAKMIRGILGER